MNLTQLDSLVDDLLAAQRRRDLDSIAVAADAIRHEALAKRCLEVAADAARDLADRFNPQCLKGQRVCMCCGGNFQPSATEHICPACAQFAEGMCQ